jgi:hypothetical protein
VSQDPSSHLLEATSQPQATPQKRHSSTKKSMSMQAGQQQVPRQRSYKASLQVSKVRTFYQFLSSRMQTAPSLWLIPTLHSRQTHLMSAASQVHLVFSHLMQVVSDIQCLVFPTCWFPCKNLATLSKSVATFVRWMRVHLPQIRSRVLCPPSQLRFR